MPLRLFSFLDDSCCLHVLVCSILFDFVTQALISIILVGCFSWFSSLTDAKAAYPSSKWHEFLLLLKRWVFIWSSSYSRSSCKGRFGNTETISFWPSVAWKSVHSPSLSSAIHLLLRFIFEVLEFSVILLSTSLIANVEAFPIAPICRER